MEVLPNIDVGYPGVDRISPWVFTDGTVAPVFDVKTVHALNYVVGYAKYINMNSCSVFCRGQGQLYANLRPSLYRGVSHPRDLVIPNAKLDTLVDSICSDATLLAELGFMPSSPPSRELVEAMLQHYGVPTRMLDAVDNHWIALWFGLYELVSEPVGGSPYALYRKRGLHAIDMAEGLVSPDEDLYQYILLIASEDSAAGSVKTIDLRLSLPQGFMRPHAQHGVMLAHQTYHPRNPFLDYSSAVVGIVRVRIDRAAQWIGSGHLISYANLFPPRPFDKGYSGLLQRADLFKKGYGWTITDYVYDVG